jgi:hypothetical protein
MGAECADASGAFASDFDECMVRLGKVIGHVALARASQRHANVGGCSTGSGGWYSLVTVVPAQAGTQ